MSGSGPRYTQYKQRTRSSKVTFADERAEEERLRKFSKLKYPDCVGKSVYETCPKEVEDADNPPSECKTCEKYIPPVSSIKERIMALQKEMKKP